MLLQEVLKCWEQNLQIQPCQSGTNGSSKSVGLQVLSSRHPWKIEPSEVVPSIPWTRSGRMYHTSETVWKSMKPYENIMKINESLWQSHENLWNFRKSWWSYENLLWTRGGRMYQTSVRFLIHSTTFWKSIKMSSADTFDHSDETLRKSIKI